MAFWSNPLPPPPVIHSLWITFWGCFWVVWVLPIPACFQGLACHDGLGFWRCPVRLRLVAVSATDLQVLLLIASTVRIGSDVVNLRSVGCCSVVIVEQDIAVWAAPLSAGFGYVEGEPDCLLPCRGAGSIGCQGVTCLALVVHMGADCLLMAE